MPERRLPGERQCLQGARALWAGVWARIWAHIWARVSAPVSARLSACASACVLAGMLALACLPARAAADTLRVGGAVVEVNLDADDFAVSRAQVLAWVKRSAQTVAGYYGRFPVPWLRIDVLPKPTDGIGFSMAFGDARRIDLGLGVRADVATLDDDWVLVHEMLHMGHPDVPDHQRWFKEGLATYVEPVARAQAGDLDAHAVWGGFVRKMPQGQPRRGDRGLDRTPTWGRTYWGGALFFLQADVRIRERTGNRKGLQDALRAILDAGGTLDRNWSLERALRVGDQAVGVPVLTALHRRMGTQAAPVDLAALWRDLGVRAGRHGRIWLDDNAPLAPIRRAILAAPQGAPG